MTGYEGTDCLTESRAKFVGPSFYVNETGGTHGSASYTSAILVSNTQIDQVYLLKIYNDFFLNTVAATCRGNTITIPNQEPDLGYHIQGSGTISGTTIQINYQVTDTFNHQVNISSTWTR